MTFGSLTLLAVLPYLNTLRNGFVYDDVTQILVNPYIRSFQYVGKILTSSIWSHFGGLKGMTNYYRPLMLLEYILCFRLVGPHPFLYHAVNLFFHTAVVVVLFKTTERLFNRRDLAWGSAAVFALHPIHTEAVAWIAAAPDLQASLFYLLTFWIFLRLDRRSGRSFFLSQLGMGISFVLALLSKEVSITAPLLATAYEHLYREDHKQTPWKQKLSRYGLLWVLAGLYVIFRIKVLGALGNLEPTRTMAYPEVFLSAIGLIGQYVGKFLWPTQLCAYYVFPENLASRLPSIAGGVLVLLLLVLLFFILWKKAKTASFGLLWFFVSLLPVLNARWMPTNVFAERYLYLPSVGLCWVLMWALTSMLELPTARAKIWRWSLITAAATLAVVCAASIIKRDRDWHDDETFYTRTLALSPNAAAIHDNLGYVYYVRGDLKAAEREWRRSLEIAPEISLSSDNLSLVYLDEGKYDEALGILLKTLQREPTDSDAHINLGMTYAKMGQLQSAESEFLTAIKFSPLSSRAHSHLGDLYYEEEKYAEAVEQYNLSIQSVPTQDAYLHLGMAYEQLGQLDVAETNYKKAVALYPWDSRFHIALGILYDVLGRTTEANQEYETAFKMEPDNPQVREAVRKFKESLAKTKGQ